MSEHGTYETVDGRPAIRFVRRLAHPPAAVWRTITEPGELAHWFPSAVRIDALEPGAPMSFVFGPDAELTGEVVEAEPPRVFAFRWGADLLRFEIAPDGDGSVLTMLHVLHEEGPDAAAKTAAGWHLCLDALAGDAPPPTSSATPAWRARYDEYVAAGVPSGADVPQA